MKKSKKQPEITIEPATKAHAKEFYGDQPTKSFKGYAVSFMGNVVGMAGLSFENNAMMLFSDMKEVLRPFKKDIWKVYDLLDEMVKKSKYPVVAVADQTEQAAERLLTKLGFSPSGHLTPDGSKIFWRFP